MTLAIKSVPSYSTNTHMLLNSSRGRRDTSGVKAIGAAQIYLLYYQDSDKVCVVPDGSNVNCLYGAIVSGSEISPQGNLSGKELSLQEGDKLYTWMNHPDLSNPDAYFANIYTVVRSKEALTLVASSEVALGKQWLSAGFNASLITKDLGGGSAIVGYDARRPPFTLGSPNWTITIGEEPIELDKFPYADVTYSARVVRAIQNPGVPSPGKYAIEISPTNQPLVPPDVEFSPCSNPSYAVHLVV